MHLLVNSRWQCKPEAKAVCPAKPSFADGFVLVRESEELLPSGRGRESKSRVMDLESDG